MNRVARFALALFGSLGVAAPPAWKTGTGPLAFEPNRGQAAAGVRYFNRGSGYAFGILVRGTVVSLRDESAAALRMSFVGAASASHPIGEGRLPGRSNYLFGSDSRQFVTGVPQFEQVRVPEIYPGIDVLYYTNGRQVEHDFRIAPHADPAAIRLRYSGMSRVRIEDGDLSKVLAKNEPATILVQ